MGLRWVFVLLCIASSDWTWADCDTSLRVGAFTLEPRDGRPLPEELHRWIAWGDRSRIRSAESVRVIREAMSKSLSGSDVREENEVGLFQKVIQFVFAEPSDDDSIPFETEGLEGSIEAFRYKKDEEIRLIVNVVELAWIDPETREAIPIRKGPQYLATGLLGVLQGVAQGVADALEAYSEVKEVRVRLVTWNPRLMESLKRLGLKTMGYLKMPRAVEIYRMGRDFRVSR